MLVSLHEWEAMDHYVGLFSSLVCYVQSTQDKTIEYHIMYAS